MKPQTSNRGVILMDVPNEGLRIEPFRPLPEMSSINDKRDEE
jgi:hypothetical protein